MNIQPDLIESGKAPGPVSEDFMVEHEFKRADLALKFNIDLIHEGTIVSTFKIELPLGSTVGDLNNLMMDQAKVKKELRIMLVSGLESFSILRILENSTTKLRKEDLVADYLTGGNHNLVSEPHIIPNGAYVIEAKTLTGKTLELGVKNTYTILELKEEIHHVDGIPANQQRIIWSGEERDDERTLNELNIEKGSKVHLVLRLRMPLESSMARKKPEQEQLSFF